MEQQSATDSNYGSTRTAEQSSMSSFSIGSSGVATGMHSKGSTSGCSSGISDNTQNRKDKKKEAIRKCLQELKSLMPQQGKAKAGTVSTLKTVLQHMKKIKGEESGGAGADIELLGAIPDGEGSKLEYPFAPDLEKKEWFKVVMSVKECLVLQVYPDLSEVLGYPKNYWFNQCLIDYVYKRDVVTLSSNLSVARGQTKTQQAATAIARAGESSGEEPEERKTMFFFRLRHYKSLRQGFSLNRSDKYTVFCGRTKIQKVPLSFPPGIPAEGLQSDNMYLVLECLPLHSAYSKPCSVPEKKSFSTRHTIYCNYNFIHPTAIPLLGYLPQDMIGTSVFEYYHPKDLQLLLGIYQQVIQMPGQTFRSPPYRMRAKNGDYVTMETEWSSFVNPWTKRFDFIMGQHEVVQGPMNPDVFMDTFLSRKPVDVNYEHRQIHKKIKGLLLQNVAPPYPMSISSLEPTPGTSRQHLPSMSTAVYRADISSSELMLSEKSSKRKPEETVTKEESSKEEEERASPTQSVGTNSSLLTLSEEEKALIYERLNYAQNILRFLNSCQGEGLEEVGQKQATPYAKATEGSESSDGEGLTVEVDIPKPPSCASSTKALVSDQEAREEVMPPSPAQEEVPEYSNQQQQQRETTADDVYEPISLTEDVLKMHNLLQEQYYLQKMTKEKEGFKSILQEGKSRKKRLLNDDAGHKKAAKFMRQEDGQASARHPKIVPNLSPPFPMTKLSRTNTPTNNDMCAQQQGKSGMIQSSVTSSMSNLPSHFMSYTPLIQMPVNVNNNTSTSMGQSGLQWPFYHPQAVSIMQPFFYQPLMPQNLSGGQGVNQGLLTPSSVPVTRATVTTPSQANAKMRMTTSASTISSQKESMKTGETSNQQEVSDEMSLGDTGSSILYLLESNSGSQNNSSNSDADQSEEDKIKKKKKLLPAAPPWVTAVNWSDDLAMRYRMPSMTLGKSLKEDKAALKKLRQHDTVIMQMQELMSQLEDMPPEEEDIDLLFITEEGIAVKEPEMTGTSTDEGSPNDDKTATPPSDSPKDHRQSPSSIEMDTQEGDSEEGAEDKNKQVVEERQEKMEMSPVSGEGSPKACSSPDKLSHDSDSACSDSGSKGSSSLTPSEQRSHEEVTSSLKESDNASSVSGCSKEKNADPDTGSDSEHQMKITRGMLMRLFVPVKIDFVAMPMQDPVWIQDANFSAAVQMTYTKDTPDLHMTLNEDRKSLDYCPQPELVREQLDELVMSLKSDSSERNYDSSSGGELSKIKLDKITEEPKKQAVETRPNETIIDDKDAERFDNVVDNLKDLENNGNVIDTATESKTQDRGSPVEIQQHPQEEAMQEGSQDGVSTTASRSLTPEESSATSRSMTPSEETPEEAAITSAVIKMEIEAKQPQPLTNTQITALKSVLTSSSDDDNFRQPTVRRRVPRSKQSAGNSVVKSIYSQQRCSPSTITSCSSSSDSPNPLIKLEKTQSGESNGSLDNNSSVTSDTWEHLRLAVKSSMTSMFEGKECSDSVLHDKKGSQGQSLVTSSEKSSERSSDFSAYMREPATVEDLMEQLFKSDDPFDSVEMD
nr:Period [Platynereis dumerilii]